MSNELLRIHDENNNCDLVAVANPMGNFHMSTYAEMQDGTQKPVDGWYLFSKMIEKLGQGGGGIDGVISKINGQWAIAGKAFDDIMQKFENGEPSIFVEEYIGNGSGASQSFVVSREVFRYVGDTDNIYINFVQSPSDGQEHRFHWYADGRIELD